MWLPPCTDREQNESCKANTTAIPCECSTLIIIFMDFSNSIRAGRNSEIYLSVRVTSALSTSQKKTWFINWVLIKNRHCLRNVQNYSFKNPTTQKKDSLNIKGHNIYQHLQELMCNSLRLPWFRWCTKTVIIS